MTGFHLHYSIQQLTTVQGILSLKASYQAGMQITGASACNKSPLKSCTHDRLHNKDCDVEASYSCITHIIQNLWLNNVEIWKREYPLILLRWKENIVKCANNFYKLQVTLYSCKNVHWVSILRTITIGWSAWLSGRTPVSGQRSFAILRSTRADGWPLMWVSCPL